MKRQEGRRAKLQTEFMNPDFDITARKKQYLAHKVAADCTMAAQGLDEGASSR
jgi:hypothetical protein